MPEPELEGLTNFLYELGLLKRYKRTGWWIAGIDNPESIAEHSFRTAIIGYVLAVMSEGRNDQWCHRGHHAV